jgi:hypothetical protein
MVELLMVSTPGNPVALQTSRMLSSELNGTSWACTLAFTAMQLLVPASGNGKKTNAITPVTYMNVAVVRTADHPLNVPWRWQW